MRASLLTLVAVALATGGCANINLARRHGGSDGWANAGAPAGQRGLIRQVNHEADVGCTTAVGCDEPVGGGSVLSARPHDRRGRHGADHGGGYDGGHGGGYGGYGGGYSAPLGRRYLRAGMYGPFGSPLQTPGYPYAHHREYVGPQGPPTAQVAYPYYTIRGPRDFLLDNPPSIGR
jgi:hypothetical protein